jgi:hypothetical protein
LISEKSTTPAAFWTAYFIAVVETDWMNKSGTALVSLWTLGDDNIATSVEITNWLFRTAPT